MDSLTGVFDYNGLVKHAKPMIERVKSTHQYVGVLAIDVCDIGSHIVSFFYAIASSVISSAFMLPSITVIISPDTFSTIPTWSE